MTYEDRICKNCGRQIGKLEAIKKWKMEPVCHECHSRLTIPAKEYSALGLTKRTECLFILIVGILSIPAYVGIPLCVWALIAWSQISDARKYRNRNMD